MYVYSSHSLVTQAAHIHLVLRNTNTNGNTNAAPGPESYPMVTFNALMVRSETMPDLAKAQALVDWIYWTQTDTSAAQIARSYVVTPHTPHTPHTAVL